MTDRLLGRSGRSVLALMSGGAIAQMAVLGARPLLTRLYTPEAFGALSVFVALAAGAAALLTLRYEDAVVLPADDRDGWRVVRVSAAAVGVGVLPLAILLWSGPPLAAWLRAPELAPALWLVPVAAGLFALANTSQAWLTRRRLFRTLSAGNAVQSLSMVAVQIGLALLAVGSLGLVWGSAVGAVVFAAVLGVRAVATRPSGARGGARALAHRYRRFAYYGLPSTALSQVSGRLPPLFLAASFGAATVGWFAVAASSVLVPLSLVGDAVGQVFAVRSAEAHRAGGLPELTARVLGQMAPVVLVPAAAAALVGPDLFAWVFGESWREAGVFAQRLAPWLALSALVPPLTRGFDATEAQRAELVAGACLALGVAAGLGVGAWTGEARGAMLALGTGGAAGRVAQLALVMRVCGVSPAAWVGRLGRGLALAALALAPASVASWLDAAPLVTIALAALGAGLGLAAVLRRGLGPTKTA